MPDGQIAPGLSPAPLMQLATGFWAFKTLAAAEELGLFTHLTGGGGVTSMELARALRIPSHCYAGGRLPCGGEASRGARRRVAFHDHSALGYLSPIENEASAMAGSSDPDPSTVRGSGSTPLPVSH
jgi:hypothetical protein